MKFIVVSTGLLCLLLKASHAQVVFQAPALRSSLSSSSLSSSLSSSSFTGGSSLDQGGHQFSLPPMDNDMLLLLAEKASDVTMAGNPILHSGPYRFAKAFSAGNVDVTRDAQWYVSLLWCGCRTYCRTHCCCNYCRTHCGCTCCWSR